MFAALHTEHITRGLILAHAKKKILEGKISGYESRSKYPILYVQGVVTHFI